MTAVVAGVLMVEVGRACASEGPLSWASPLRVDNRPPFASPAAITGVSCPSTGLCVAVDSVGDVLVSTDPSGGTPAWVKTYASENSTGVEGFTGVSCPSTKLCVAVDAEGDVVTLTDPAGAGSTWTSTEVVPRNAEGESDRLEAVSCPSESLCAVTDDRGDVLTSADPVNAASAWTKTKVTTPNKLGGGNALGGLSCPSVRLCLATASEGNMVSSTDPTGGMGAWSETDVDGTADLSDVSCVSDALCVASNNSGDILSATEPTGGKSAWTVASVSGRGLIEHVSCASSGLCIALGDNEVITSIEPAGGAPAWKPAVIPTSNKYGSDPSLDAAACPSLGLCVLGDDGSAVVSTTEPTKGASAWTVTSLEVGVSSLQSVSCAPVGLCVAVDDAGNILTSTDPAGGAGAWSEAHVDSHELDGVSCPSAGLCVAVDNDGDVLTSTDPAGGAGAWTVVDVDTTRRLKSVSCPSVGLCVAIDSEGDIVSSADPTGGVGAWGFVRLYPGLSGVSCPSEHLCVLTAEGYIITSTEPAAGADTWSLKYVGANKKISCPSVSLCVTVGDGPAPILTMGNPMSSPSSWTQTHIEGLNGLDEVSCAHEGLCLATSFGANGSDGNVISSDEPAGADGAWVESNVYGIPIRPPDPIIELRAEELTGASCVPKGMCVVVDVRGQVMVGTPPQALAPVNASAPVAFGTPALGQTLSCSNGSWTSNPPPTFTYQWLRDGAPIAGAAGSTYQVLPADEGGELACEVTATNSGGSASAVSNTLLVPGPRPPGDGSGDSLVGGSETGGPASGGGPGSSANASNAFKVLGITDLTPRGAVKLTLQLPGPGVLQILATASTVGSARTRAGRRGHTAPITIARLRLAVKRGGRFATTLVLDRAGKALLAEHDLLRANFAITYTPTGGIPRSFTRHVTFRYRHRH